MSVVRIDEVGGRSLDRVNKLLAGISGGAWKAASSALKRAGDTAKTKAGQYAAAEYTIRKGDFMRSVDVKSHITNTGGDIVSMSVTYAGRVTPLLMFSTRFSRDGRVQTQVKRNGGAATLEQAFVSGMFGQAAVFERVGAPRFPVEQKFGPSTAHMMRNEQVIQRMETTIRDTYDTRIEYEIMRILNGWGMS